MKRSRRSEYDKKRNSSKKHSERKFRYSKKTDKATSHSKTNSNSSSNKDTIDRLKSFEINENNEKKYKNRTVKPVKKTDYSGLKAFVIFGILVFSIIRLVVNLTSSQTQNTPLTTQDKALERILQETKKFREIASVRTTDFIAGKNKIVREVTQLTKDSTLPILEHVTLKLFDKFHMYDTSSLPNTEVLAKFAKYYFFYDRVEKSPNLSMSAQWEQLRNAIANSVTTSVVALENGKNRTYKDMKIEEIDFKILYNNAELHGVATLIEFENTRYFFQFFSKEKAATHFRRNYLRKYLDYYLKIR
ncbi:hypothetical protein EZY14_017695 [Kordia sp. TARA_039_SRF]|nr:hypothetical protein EZY14_017695 [Kordia sp. TARA_039_SRF]